MKTSVIEVFGLLSALSVDVVLLKSDPYDVLGAIELSRATLRKMHQNLFWAWRITSSPFRRRLVSFSR